MDDSKPLEVLKRLVETGNRATVCNKFGISPQYLSDILNGRRSISERIGNKLGFKPIWKENPHDK